MSSVLLAQGELSIVVSLRPVICILASYSMVHLADWDFATFMETDLGQPFSRGATRGLELRFVESYLHATDCIPNYKSRICSIGH